MFSYVTANKCFQFTISLNINLKTGNHRQHLAGNPKLKVVQRTVQTENFSDEISPQDLIKNCDKICVSLFIAATKFYQIFVQDFEIVSGENFNEISRKISL